VNGQGSSNGGRGYPGPTRGFPAFIITGRREDVAATKQEILSARCLNAWAAGPSVAVGDMGGHLMGNIKQDTGGQVTIIACVPYWEVRLGGLAKGRDDQAHPAGLVDKHRAIARVHELVFKMTTKACGMESRRRAVTATATLPCTPPPPRTQSHPPGQWSLPCTPPPPRTQSHPPGQWSLAYMCIKTAR